MVSHVYNSRRAFTLLEVLIVLALMAVVISTAVFSCTAYTTYSRASEHARLVMALQSARTRAMNSDYALPAGVAIYPSGYAGYVIFSGTAFEARVSAYDENIPATYLRTPTAWSSSIVIFTPLSGTTTPTTIVLTDPWTGLMSTTTITYDGYIE